MANQAYQSFVEQVSVIIVIIMLQTTRVRMGANVCGQHVSLLSCAASANIVFHIVLPRIIWETLRML